MRQVDLNCRSSGFLIVCPSTGVTQLAVRHAIHIPYETKAKAALAGACRGLTGAGNCVALPSVTLQFLSGG